MSEANGAFGGSFLSTVESVLGEFSNNLFEEVSGLGLEVLHIIFILISVLLDLSNDSAKVAFNEAHEGLLVGELDFLEFHGSGNITFSSGSLGNVDREYSELVGLGLSVAIVAHDVTSENADPFVVSNVSLFDRLLFHGFFVLVGGLLLLFRETLLISCLGMFAINVLVGLNHTLGNFELSFADNALSFVGSFSILNNLSRVSDDTGCFVFLLLGLDNVLLRFCHFL